jgi:hypothetical protein
MQKVWCVPSATLVPHTDRSQNKVTGITLLVTFLFKSLLYLKTKEFTTRHLFLKRWLPFATHCCGLRNQSNNTCTLSECSYVEPWSLSLSFSYIIPNCRQLLLRHLQRWECWLLCDLCAGHSLLLFKKKPIITQLTVLSTLLWVTDFQQLDTCTRYKDIYCS